MSERSCLTCRWKTRHHIYGNVCTNPKVDPEGYAANGMASFTCETARTFSNRCGIEGKHWEDPNRPWETASVPLTMKGRYTRWQRFKLWLWEKLA